MAFTAPEEVFIQLLRPAKPALLGLFLFVWGWAWAQQVPPAPPFRQGSALGSQWLVRGAGVQLQPFDPVRHSRARALHQWVRLQPRQPFPVSFTAHTGQSLFLENRLVFRAISAGEYTLDLAALTHAAADSAADLLLTISHPSETPLYHTYRTAPQQPQGNGPEAEGPAWRMPRPANDQSVYVLFLLALGFIYGLLRYAYSSDWASIYGTASLRPLAADDTFYRKPVSSASGFLFLLAFSLSLALITVAIQRDLKEAQVLRQVFEPARLGIAASVLAGTGLVALAMVLKLAYLRLMAYVFDLRHLVPLQYREFVRSSLLLGAVLPVALLLYLSLGQAGQARIGEITNWVLMLLLAVPMLRVLVLIGSKYQLGNIQLFCYLCATEVIPLAIILKIIFLRY